MTFLTVMKNVSFICKLVITEDCFTYLWTDYKANTRKFDKGEHFMQRHLYKHFTSL